MVFHLNFLLTLQKPNDRALSAVIAVSRVATIELPDSREVRRTRYQPPRRLYLNRPSRCSRWYASHNRVVVLHRELRLLSVKPHTRRSIEV